MKKSDLLKQKRAQKIEAQKVLHNTAEAETRSLNETETTSFRALQKEIAGLDGEIEDALAYEENLRSVADKSGKSVFGDEDEDASEKRSKKPERSYSLAAHIRGVMNGKLTGAELEAQTRGSAEFEASGAEVNDGAIYIPADLMNRASQQTVSQDGGLYGGQLVVDQTPILIDGFMPRLFLEDLGANVWTGLTGGDIPLPVSPNYDFEWLDEGEALTVQKKQFGTSKLSPKRVGAFVSISKRLIIQSSVDVENAIKSKLRDGIRRALEFVAIQGLAVNKQPVGILNKPGVLSSVNQVAFGPATYANIVELQGLVEGADSTQNSVGYLTNPRLFSKLKTVSKGTDMGGAINMMNTIDGVKTVATSLVPAIPGAGANPATYPLIYGDFSQLYVGIWGGMEIVVDSTSTEAASRNSVNLIINMLADVQIAIPQAFAVNTFITA